MTYCEKCIYGEICADRDCYDEDDERALTYCSEFKNKADFVEVVRCKDCEYWKNKDCRKDIALVSPNENDYCSYGKRRDT